MWTPVPDFDIYEASDDGYVRNAKTGRVLKNSVLRDGSGIPCISLVRNIGFTRKVHVFETRFVIACTYLGVDIWARPKPKFEYIDGNKFNNSASNIRFKDSNDLDGEEWRPVVGFEDSYAVSNLGRVKRLARSDTYIRQDTGQAVERLVADNIMTLTDNDRYYEINLYADDRCEWRRVHRMVAEAFLANSDNLPQVNHIDGNKHNNKVDNLEWCTSQQNVQHSIETKLRPCTKGIDVSRKRVKCIETGQVFDTLKEAAASINTGAQYLRDRIDLNRPCHNLHFEILPYDKRIKCLDTGQIFSGVNEAETYFNIHSISESIKNHTCVDGWTFYRMDCQIDETTYLQEARNRYSRWPRANKRWEDG